MIKPNDINFLSNSRILKFQYPTNLFVSQATSLNSGSIFCLNIFIIEVVKDEILFVRVGFKEGLTHVGLVDEFESVVDNFELVADSVFSRFYL
jgi:hypothetical protein